MVTFWATFGKFWATLISGSGHTGCHLSCNKYAVPYFSINHWEPHKVLQCCLHCFVNVNFFSTLFEQNVYRSKSCASFVLSLILNCVCCVFHQGNACQNNENHLKIIKKLLFKLYPRKTHVRLTQEHEEK